MEHNDTVITKMQNVEDILEQSLHRVDVIQKRLKTKLLTTENRERLVHELVELKAMLKKNRDELQGLRKENTKSFMVAACFIFVCYLIYGLYLMLFGNVL